MKTETGSLQKVYIQEDKELPTFDIFNLDGEFLFGDFRTYADAKEEAEKAGFEVIEV